MCLIPGAGEFVLATDVVLRRDGLTVSTPENMNNPTGRADLLVSLDLLQAQLPGLEAVSLVVAWFGDDLRAGSCRVRPGGRPGVQADHAADLERGGDRARATRT